MSVGRSGSAACAAIHAKLANPVQLRYHDAAGEPVIGHRVTDPRRPRGAARLAGFVLAAIAECCDARTDPGDEAVPILLCLPEPVADVPLASLLAKLLPDAVRAMTPSCRVQACYHGRSGVALALLAARDRLARAPDRPVIVAGCDSLLDHRLLASFEAGGRLATSTQSDGFLPGEGAAALLLATGAGEGGLAIDGIGVAQEQAHVDSGLPLRADGLRAAIQAASADGAGGPIDYDFVVSDVGGEQYAFRESSLAVSRTLGVRKAEFESWQPAESIGHCGVALALACLGVVDDAYRSGSAPGPRVLIHFGDDDGRRAAVLGTGR